MRERILYFCPYMRIGGTERHLCNLLPGITSQFEVMVSAPDGPLTPLLSEKVDQLVAYPGPMRVSLSETREGMGRLRELIGGFRPDLIHVHASREMVWMARKVTKKIGTRCPLVFTPHAYTGSFDFFLTWLYARLADRVIAVSNAERVRLARFFPESARDERVVWIPNGTPLADEELRETPGRRFKGLTIGTTSRLSKEKGIIHLLRAFAMLSAEFADCRLVIVGDGRLRESLERNAASLGVSDRVKFTGALDDPIPAVAEFDIYVSSSLNENFSVSIVEAMALGKPVVATRVGGTPDAVVHGETGLLCEPADPQRLAECIRELLVSPDMRMRMGESARRRAVDMFSIRKMADRTASLYRELLTS
jgi:glycosyltransferase involved in cell wall biosynthesis